MRTKLLKFIALPLAGIVAFFIFLGLTFPDERVQVLVQRKMESGLDYKYRVEMLEFEFGIFSGIHMKGVSLTPRFEFDQKLPPGAEAAAALPAEPEPAGDDGEPQVFCPEITEPLPVMIESISVDPSLLSLLGAHSKPSSPSRSGAAPSMARSRQAAKGRRSRPKSPM